MKKLLKNSCSIMCMLLLILSMFSIPVKAADSASVSISSASVTNGDSVTVKVTVSSNSDMLLISLWLSYDTEKLEYVSGATGGGGGSLSLKAGDGGTDVYRSVTYSIKFNTKAAGTASVSINKDHVESFIGGGIDNMSFNAASGSVTVTTPADETYSSNNNLSSLSISPGSLSPAFSPDITSYTATVGSDCAALVVSAPVQDSTARVSVAGKTMDPGMNTTTITVTAQDGSVKKYVIKTTKNAAAVTPTDAPTAANVVETVPAVAEITTTVNGSKYNVVSDFTNHPLPDGYTATEMDYNGQKITAGKGANGLTIVYLENADGSGEGNFYVYDAASNSFSLLSTVTQPTLTYTILPIPSSMEIPDNYTKSNLTINGNNVEVLIHNDSNVKYCLFYGVDSTGKAGWYRYDYAEQTVQKYYGNDLVSEAAPALKQSDNATMWKIIAASSAVVSFILLAAVIVLAFKVKSKKSESYYEDDDNNEEEEDIFNLIAHRELASKESSDSNDLNKNDLSDDALDINNLENDGLSDQEDYSSEIAAEIGIDAAATQEINFEEDDFELDSEELLEDDEFELDIEALSGEDDQDNDISDMKDILEDDDEDSEDDENNSDEDDFEFLDIEDLDLK